MTESVASQGFPDLAQLFSAALQGLTAEREELNALDGFNGNHGDNMVQNLQVVTEALAARSGSAPADALRYAAQVLQVQGKGGTSQYYSQGLGRAARELEGHAALEQGDVMTLIQSLLGAVPAEGHPQQGQAAPSVLDMVLNMAGAQAAPPRAASAPQPTPTALGSLLDLARGVITRPPSQVASPQPAQPPATPQADKLDMGDVLERLLPAGLAFLQAKQAGADTSQAMQQALIEALLGGQSQKPTTPRAASGSLIAQRMLQAFLGRR